MSGKPEVPTNAELRKVIRKLIPKVDLQKTGVKAFTKLLSKECGGLDLKHRSEFIKVELSAAINEIESSGDEESSEDDAPKKPSGKGKGLSIKKEISPALADFLKQGNEMARTEIVKALWVYIKENDLQNPENKREILLDAKLKQVFGCDSFTMFTMNKYIGAHIHPFKEVDLTKNSTPKSPKKKRKRKGNESPLKKTRKAKRPGLQPPYQLSDALAQVLGKDILPRPQVVKGIWGYIKENNLQNPKDKREIICDGKLKTIMGGRAKVTMFNMNRYITNHLVEKLDRSAYTHDEDDAAASYKVKKEEDEDNDDDDDDEGSLASI